MTRDELRAAIPEIAGLADTFRAMGHDVKLLHVEFADGREIGKRPTLAANEVELDWTHAALIEADFSRKRR